MWYRELAAGQSWSSSDAAAAATVAAAVADASAHEIRCHDEHCKAENEKEDEEVHLFLQKKAIRRRRETSMQEGGEKKEESDDDQKHRYKKEVKAEEQKRPAKRSRASGSGLSAVALSAEPAACAAASAHGPGPSAAASAAGPAPLAASAPAGGVVWIRVGNGWLTDRKPETARHSTVTYQWCRPSDDEFRVLGDLVNEIAKRLENEDEVALHCRCGRGCSGIVIFLVMRCLGYTEFTCLQELMKMNPELHDQFIIKPSEECTLHWMTRRAFNDSVFRRCVDGAEGVEKVDLDSSSSSVEGELMQRGHI